MNSNVLANWAYAIQILLSVSEDTRFLVVQDGEFRTACLPRDNCKTAKMRLYVIQTGPSPMLMDHHRDIKIGYYYHHPDGNKTKYYLTATEEDDYEVSATTDFDKGLLLHMTIQNSLDFKLFDPISKRHLHALPVTNCAVGTLALVDDDHPARNISSFKIYTKSVNYFSIDLSCC